MEKQVLVHHAFYYDAELTGAGGFVQEVVSCWVTMLEDVGESVPRLVCVRFFGDMLVPSPHNIYELSPEAMEEAALILVEHTFRRRKCPLPTPAK